MFKQACQTNIEGKSGEPYMYQYYTISLLCFLEVFQGIVAASLSQVTQVFFLTKNPICPINWGW